MLVANGRRLVASDFAVEGFGAFGNDDVAEAFAVLVAGFNLFGYLDGIVGYFGDDAYVGAAGNGGM